MSRLVLLDFGLWTRDFGLDIVQYKDYYNTLGVKRGASEKEIKSAFRKLARKHTPISTPTTARPKPASKRSTRPTKCSATPRSARSTTGSAPTGSNTSTRRVHPAA